MWNNGNWNSGNWNSGNWNSGNVNVWNNHHNNYNNFGVVNGGGWGYPGWGGGWSNAWNNGYVNPHYGWYNSCWNGNWGAGYGGGWWAPFAFGAATWGLLSTCSNWGLGYGALGYGSAGYVNPYYAAMPATVVASAPYDYSQPIVVNNYVTTDPAAQTADGSAVPPQQAAPPSDEANALVDAALAKFKAGDYGGALAGFDAALKRSPKDSVIHEVRALALFALGRYAEAAATLNAVLAAAPGMDWTTVSSIYGSVDAYTGHLRKLEQFCEAHPDDAGAHFVLAYHYLVGGHADSAVEALEVVVAEQPSDVVAKRLLDALKPPAEEKAAQEPQETKPEAEATKPAAEAEAAAAPETDLVGTWKATSGTETVELVIGEDSTFSWKAAPPGKPAVELTGTIETTTDAIALVSEKAGTMVAQVKSQGPDAFEFSLPGAPKDAKPLRFERQKQ